MNGRRGFVLVLCVVLLCLSGGTPALADGAQLGADLHVAQTLGDRELTVVIRRADPGGPLPVEIVTHAGTRPGTLSLRASAAGTPASEATVTLGTRPGPHPAVLHVDRPGPWELSVDDGERVALIPFVVAARVVLPWEATAYGGFVAAGVLLLVALVVAVRSRRGWPALLPAGGLVAALAVGITAAVLSASAPPPRPLGTLLDPTADNITDPYPERDSSTMDYSRPPVSLIPEVTGTDLTLHLRDSATGRPADDLLVRDSALVHLLVVGPAGQLQHLHPVRTAPGEYHVRLRSDGSGEYALAAELSRRGGGVQLVRATARLGGEPRPPEVAATQADLKTTGLTTGGPSTITATFGDTADLQPWLGMLGHLIIVGPLVTSVPVSAAPVWAHVHAMPPPSPAGQPDETVAAYGPAVSFTYTFPLPGRYQIWAQAERDYAVLTVPATVEITAGTEPTVLRDSGSAHTVELAIDSPRVGANVVELMVTDTAGRPAGVDDVTVAPVMAQMGHATPPVAARAAGPGRYRAAALSLPMAGQWSLMVTLRSAAGLEDVTFPIQVNG